MEPKLKKGLVPIKWVAWREGETPESVPGWFLPPLEESLFAATEELMHYVVTHVPTGCSVVNNQAKRSAVRIVRELTALLKDDPFWRGTTATDRDAMKAWQEMNPDTWQKLTRGRNS